MKRNTYLFRLILDILIVLLTYAITKIACNYWGFQSPENSKFLLIYLVSFWYFAAEFTNLYNQFLSRSISEEIIAVAKTIIVQFSFIVISFFFLSKRPFELKWFVLIFVIIELFILPIGKYLVRFLYGNILNKYKGYIPILIVGTGEVAKFIVDYINKNQQLTYYVTGFIGEKNNDEDIKDYLGNIGDLNNILKQQDIHEVLITLPNSSFEAIQNVIKISQLNGKRVRIIPDYINYSSSISINNLGEMPILTVNSLPLDKVEYQFFKRLFDLLLSSIAIICIFSWLYPLIAVLIKLTSKGPALFIQKRVGYMGKLFNCYKFRTMKSDARGNNFTPTAVNDNRITNIGKFLRKSNLDELPQIINVFIGNMSIVGPRPHSIPFHKNYSTFVDNIENRNLIKPGITGLAQINGLRGDVLDVIENKKRVIQRMDLDIRYMENWSFWLDCQIILQTVINMIKGDKNAY
jgi:putative colanic acid biosynthesis UDP-glucose lipid carrier transferase